MLHLGIAAFFGIGAYITGILVYEAYPFQLSFWLVLILAPLGAAVMGIVLGAPTLRLRGDYLALVTLGFGEVVRFVLRNWVQITNGTQGLGPLPYPSIPQPLPTLLGWLKISPEWQADFRLFYYLNLGVLILVFVALRRLEGSRIGRAWVAVREDELAATCMGLSATRAKLSAFALGAALAGLAGCLYVTTFTNTSNPDTTYNFNTSVTLLCCLILGGLGSLRGAVLGAFLLFGFESILMPQIDQWIQKWSQDSGWSGDNRFLVFSNWKYMIYGLALILMMRFRPEGLFPSRRIQEELHSG